MKKLVVLSMVLVFVSSMFSLQAQEINCNTQVKKAGKYSEVVLDVPMHCNSCADKVEKQLAFTKGVKSIKIDVDKNLVVVMYKNTKTDSDKLITSLSEIGYTATIHQEKCSSSSKSCCSDKKKHCCSDK